MGNGGSTCTTQEIQPKNYCCTNVGQYAPDPVVGACTHNDSDFERYSNEICNLMTNTDEWRLEAEPTVNISLLESDCHYGNDQISATTDDDSCGTRGTQVICGRSQYRGDPISCCLNDFNCQATCENGDSGLNQNQYNLCFSDPASATMKNYTCNPIYRNLVGQSCRENLFLYCTGNLPTDDYNSPEWLNRWSGEKSCTYALHRNMFAINNGSENVCLEPPVIIPGICNITTNYNHDGYVWAQAVIREALKHYTDLGFNVGSIPGQEGYNIFQDLMYEQFCCPYAGVCSTALDEVCKRFTAELISRNPILSNWCGCHLPEEEYQSYSVNYNIRPECTPVCNRTGVIPLTGINGDPVQCEQDICLIDNTTFNLVNSQVGGNVNFNQICKNCPNANCSCISENNTLDITNSTIAGNVIPVAQICGNLTCTQTNPSLVGPQTINIPCENLGTNPFSDYDSKYTVYVGRKQRSSRFTTLLIMGLGLVILIIMIYILYPKNESK